MALKSSKKWKLTSPTKESSSVFIDSKMLFSGPSRTDDIQSLVPIGRFDRITSALKRKKQNHLFGIALLSTSSALAFVMARKAYINDFPQFWTYFPIPIVMALLSYPLLKIAGSKNHQIDWTDIERLSLTNNEGLQKIYRRAKWLRDHQISPYVKNNSENICRLSGFDWHMENASMFILGLDEHRASLGLSRLTNECKLFFKKSDVAPLIVEEQEIPDAPPNIASVELGTVRLSEVFSIAANETKHSLNEKSVRQADVPLDASSASATPARMQLPLFGKSQTIRIRKTLKSTKFPITRSLVYDLDRSIRFLNYVETARASGSEADYLKVTITRERWLAAIKVIVENWQDWVKFTSMKHLNRCQSHNYQAFDKKLRDALGVSSVMTKKDPPGNHRFKEDPPKYRKFIDAGTTALEKWFADILAANPDAF